MSAMSGCVCLGIIITVLTAICEADPLCNGSYHETVFPKLYHEGKAVDLDRIDYYSRLILVFSWRSERMNIALKRHSGVLEDALLESVNENGTVVTDQLQDDKSHFQGHVLGARFSFVAMAIGKFDMTGYIQFDGEGVSIEPHKDDVSWTQPAIHRANGCGRTSPTQKRSGRRDFERSRARIRRAPSQYTKFLEVLLVADSTVVAAIGKGRVKTYLLTLMNIVNEVYHDDTLGVNIEVVTVKIMFMDRATEGHVIVTNDPQRTVDQFCYWASTQTYRSRRYARETRGSNHDTAVLLTRHKFTAAGYAPITGMCVPMRNCAFVRDDGFSSAFVIAHEVGHIFGLMHDGHGNSCYGREYTTSIMATMVQSAFNRYWWSGCSKSRMQQVIGGLTCLNNNPHHVIREDLPDPVGINWTLDDQCKFEFGSSAKHCQVFAGKDPCRQMWCTGDYAYTCTTKNVIPLDGTQCGPTKQWYCLQGVCGYHGNQTPLEGSWGQWGTWSNCSADCGVGFKRRSRQCDNPEPQFGGKECDGESENVDTCKAQILECLIRVSLFDMWTCAHYEDKRANQCSIMDIVPVRGSTHVWQPYQLDTVSDRCKLTCISQTDVVMTFDSLVDNGTPCSYDDLNSICIDGRCQFVGCDGIRGSKAKEDRCGVCQGDGTMCKTVSGVYSKKFNYSAAGQYYERMLVLPKGSRDISIAENGVSPHFISVQDTLYFKKIINADGKQGGSKNFVLEGAWFKYYNNGGYEKLSAKGPIQGDVHVMIYPTNWNRPTDVRYSYTIDKDDYTYEKNKYQWKFEDWSACTVTCGKGGVQHILYGCYDRETGQKTDKESCQYVESPGSEDIECSRAECSTFFYMWRLLRDHSECSATCGDEGMHHLLFECEERETENKADDFYCSNIPPPIITSPCNRIPCVEVSYRWDVTAEWSECSTSCGTDGTQHQLYYCIRMGDGIDEEQVDDRFCSDLVSPKEPRSCNQIPCLEYKWALTDDWVGCNETCGETGMQKRKVLCNKYEIGKAEKPVGIWYCRNQDKPMESRACNVRACFTYEWEESNEWSECSQTCGNDAVRQMTLHCKNVTYDNRETRVSEEFCNEDNKPDVIANCSDLKPCEAYEWKTSTNWTNCSSVCGTSGTRSRVYQCISLPSGKEVSVSLCSNSTKPIEEEPCNVFPCEEFRIQHVDTWFPVCPEDCHGNPVSQQTRQTKCFQVFSNGRSEQTDDHLCANLEKPSVMVRPCKTTVCSSQFSWKDGGWSRCSETCGQEGIQSLTVQCVETMKDGTRRVVDNGKCDKKRPIYPNQRPCQLPPCLRYKATSDWSPCSVTCGLGQQTRDGICMRNATEGLEVEVPIEECKGEERERNCTLGPCDFMEWGAGPWSMCSKTCGPGQQKRFVYCGLPLKNSDPALCPGAQPTEYRDCQMEPCRGNLSYGCRGDRAKFCKKANLRLCSHPAFNRVCCRSCGATLMDQPRPRFRNYWANK